MKKLFILILVIAAVVSVFSSCAEKEKQEINAAVLAGPTGMGAAKLMSDNASGKTENKYNFTVASSPDELTGAIINGTVDIAAVPTNLASILYNKTEGGVKVIAVNTLGVLYMLEIGDSVNSVEDLRGKTIYASGQAAVPEYALRYILNKNGIDPDNDVTISYYGAHAELASLVSAGNVSLAMLPEPNVTAVKNASPDVRIALNLTEEWNKVAGDESSLMMGCVVVRSEFAEENKNAVETFLKEYKASIEYVTSDNEAASILIEEQGIIPKAAVALKALPNCNIVYIDGNDMKEQLSGFLSVLFEANPASVGGKLPDDAFYYVG